MPASSFQTMGSSVESRVCAFIAASAHQSRRMRRKVLLSGWISVACARSDLGDLRRKATHMPGRTDQPLRDGLAFSATTAM